MAQASGPGRAQAAGVVALARHAMTTNNLKAVILRVMIDGRELVTEAMGESMTGVPATKDMHFRNGAVAISYISTVLLQLVDQGKVRLDDKLSKWSPGLPNSDRVSLRMLANMTAGYSDYVADEGFIEALYADPFRQFSPKELIAIGTSKPQVFEPGTNWDYSHTNYVILAQALEKITGKRMATLMQENIVLPLGLKDTDNPPTAVIRAPVLHAFSSERREPLGIDVSKRFYEESTYWNPSWTLAEGAIQTTNIYDLTATAIAVGTGSLLSPESHHAQVGPSLMGFGHPAPGCRTCHTLDKFFSYGLGVVLKGSWILQNPLFGGYSAVEAYLPSKKIAVAVAATFGEESFDEQGGIKNHSDDLFAAVGAHLAPDDPPPARR